MNLIRKHLDAWAATMEECGISHWVYSPGSRNAPLLAALMRRPFFKLHEQVDERSAAYMALGMAQQLQYPCAVLCTSGTAAANWLPATAEAFYQRIPLLLVSADRPIEALDNWRGQTIRQDQLFHRHVRGEFRLPDNLDTLEQSRTLEASMHQALTQSLYPIPGPVHINFPLREPLYEGFEFLEPQAFECKPFVWARPNPEPVHEQALRKSLEPYSRIALVLGQMPEQIDRNAIVSALNDRIAVFADVCSQHQSANSGTWEAALLNAQTWPSNLEPDLLITMGLSNLSKALHRCISTLKPRHWHVSTAAEIGDQFGTSVEHKQHFEVDFLAALDAVLSPSLNYGATWKNLESNPPKAKRPYEWEQAKQLLSAIPADAILHLGNSMSIRYASWYGKLPCQVQSNRGTSGIDGSLSTAVGAALATPEKQHVLLLGDLSFVYDQHGLWSYPRAENLSIWVLNNQGGRIFEQIEGPAKWPALQQRISSPHTINLQALCEQYGVSYLRCSAEQCISHWRERKGLQVYEIPCMD